MSDTDANLIKILSLIKEAPGCDTYSSSLDADLVFELENSGFISAIETGGESGLQFIDIRLSLKGLKELELLREKSKNSTFSARGSRFLVEKTKWLIAIIITALVSGFVGSELVCPFVHSGQPNSQENYQAGRK